MSVDTKAIIAKGTTIQSIAETLEHKYKNVKIQSTSMDYFFAILFADGDDQRTLYVSFSNSCEQDYGIPGVWLSLGYWGNSVKIMTYLCETFGGYIDENDCDGIGFQPICLGLYLQSPELTILEIFKHKIISVCGIDKVNDVIALCDEYKSLIL